MSALKEARAHPGLNTLRILPFAVVATVGLLSAAVLTEIVNTYFQMPERLKPLPSIVQSIALSALVIVVALLLRQIRRVRADIAKGSFLRVRSYVITMLLFALVALLASWTAGLVVSLFKDTFLSHRILTTLVGVVIYLVATALAADKIFGFAEPFFVSTVDGTYRVDKHRPDVLIMAMSRRKKDICLPLNGDVVAQLRSLDENDPDPIRTFLEKTEDSFSEHPWQQTARSFCHHFGPRPSAPQAYHEHLPRILVVVSNPISGSPGKEWGGMIGDTMGFEEFCNTLLKTRFGDTYTIERLSAHDIDIASLQAVDAAIRAKVATLKLPRRNRHVVVDITSGTALYSAAGVLATIDVKSSVSNVDPNSDNLTMRRVIPLR